MSFPLPWHPCGLPSKLIKLRTQLKTNPSKKMHPCDSVTVMRCLSQSKGQLLLKGTVGLNQRRCKTVLLHKAFHSAGCGTATGTFSFCSWMYLEWFLKLRWTLPVHTQSLTCWIQNSIFHLSSAFVNLKTVWALVYADFEFIPCLIAILNFTVAFDYGNKLILNEDSDLTGLAGI